MLRHRRRRAHLTLFVALAALAVAPTAAIASPPANDDFAHSQAVALPAHVTGSYVDATLESGEPDTGNEYLDHTVWYELTTTATEQVRIDTCDSNPVTQLAVYTGSNVNSLNEVVASANDCDGGARVYFTAALGTTYHVRVSGYLGPTGSLVLNVARPQAPANDDFEDATPLALPASVTATTVDATTQAGEPVLPDTASGHSVWYRVVATTTGPLVVGDCDGTTDSALAVYTSADAALGQLAEVGSRSLICGPRSGITVYTTPGTTYYIAVRGYGDRSGAFTLSITDQGAPWMPSPDPVVVAPPNPACPFQLAAPGSVTYKGTWSGGGEVCLTVKPDFSGLSWFTLTRPPTGCDLPWAVERFEPALAIAGQRFAATTPSAVLSGRFTSSHEARGTITLLRPAASGSCRTAPLAWKATTTATTPFPDPDLTAPALRLGGATVQHPLRRNALLVSVRCPREACLASASTTIAGRKLMAPSHKLRAARSATLRISLSLRARRAIRTRSGLRARVTVVARDAAGNRRSARRTITMRG